MLQSDPRNWSLGDRISSLHKAIYLELVQTSFAIRTKAAILEVPISVIIKVVKNGQIKMIL